ncbi:MAG: DNA cytosine methyltransferase [Fusobacteriaceae bacterium]
MIKIIELFAGVGSQTQALKNIGIDHEVVGIAEIDKYAISSYMQLHGETPLLGDITTIESLPNADLWTYSFPCQDISVAGKGLGIKEGTRSGLLSHVERLLESSVKPKYLLMENVKNLIGKNHKPDFDIWCKKLEELGYKNFYQVLNAKDFGVPQNRERVFMVSTLKDENYVFPIKKTLNVKLKEVLDEQVDESYYLKQEIIDRFTRFQNDRLNNSDIGIVASSGRNPNNPNDRTIGASTEQRLEFDSKGTSNTITTVQKDNYVFVANILKEKYVNKFNEAILMEGYGNPIICEQRVDEGLRSFKDNVCGTLRTIDTCGDKRVLTVINEAHNFNIRKLTPKECWRLMGWKDEQFNKIQGISNAQLYKQAGNGIVVNVLEAIFKNLFTKQQY